MYLLGFIGASGRMRSQNGVEQLLDFGRADFLRFNDLTCQYHPSIGGKPASYLLIQAAIGPDLSDNVHVRP